MSGTLFMLIVSLVYAHLAAIVLITYKIRNPFLRWVCVFYPVTWLYFLFQIRFDIFSGLFVWMPASIGVFALVIMFIVDICSKKSGYDIPYYKMRFMRPLLTLAIFILALFAHNHSQKAADSYAIEKAKEIQALSQTNGKCPPTIDNWKIDGECYTMYGEFGPDFPITYNGYKDEFVFYVHHKFEDRFYIKGGVGKKLEAFRIFESERTDFQLE